MLLYILIKFIYFAYLYYFIIIHIHNYYYINNIEYLKQSTVYFSCLL